MVEKPSIIITSLGRTGTKFFSILFRELIPDGTSLHEPDVLNISQYEGIRERSVELAKQLREAGLFNLVIRKALGKWGLIEIADERFRGAISYSEAVKKVLRQRARFIDSCPGSIYVESSIAYYGLIDVSTDIFKYHKIAYIVRDGRDWVRSWMNWSDGNGMYDKGKVRSIVAHTWPTALELEGDPYAPKWRSMSRFERLCWGWAILNRYALKTVEKNRNARVFRFEDVFRAEDCYQNLGEMVRFLTTFPGCEEFSVGPVDGWLDRRIHKSEGQFPPWNEWPPEHKRQFESICGPLMEKLNYSF